MSIDPDSLPYRPCVGVMVINRDGLVFVGRRAGADAENEGSGHWWQMPQGGIDGGEDPRAAALRELYEETSIRSVEIIAESHEWLTYELPAHLLGVAWKGRYRGQKQKWFAARFTGTEEEINILDPGDGHKPEFEDWKWVKGGALVDLIVPFKRSVYEQVVAEFAHLAGR
jgi:putative (di)nucleoside polyphosphate hydrolase